MNRSARGPAFKNLKLNRQKEASCSLLALAFKHFDPFQFYYVSK